MSDSSKSNRVSGDDVDRFLRDLLVAGVDCAVARLEFKGGSLERAAGIDVDGKVTRASSWFDLASLTKAFVGTLALVLDEGRQLPLQLTVGEVLEGTPGFLHRVSLEDLLRHRSGLRPWLPMYQLVDGESSALDCLNRESSWGAKVPSYSDLGYILWGLLAERAMGRPLSRLVSDHVLRPLRIEELVAPTPGPLPQVLACRLDNRVEVRLAKEQDLVVPVETAIRRGAPQDGNARFLTARGDLVGHAGLFGCAEGVAGLGRSWLADSLLSDDLRARALVTPYREALGWWRYLKTPPSDEDRKFGPDAFGMVGFTGTSCWVDPGRGLVAVLLAHRRHTDLDMRPWRHRFHQLALAL